MMAETGHPRNTKVELYLPPEDDCSIVFVPPGLSHSQLFFFPSGQQISRMQLLLLEVCGILPKPGHEAVWP